MEVARLVRSRPLVRQLVEGGPPGPGRAARSSHSSGLLPRAEPLRAVSRGRRALVGAGAVGLAAAVAGCGGQQSALDPAGRPAGEIADLWWGMFAGAVVVFAVVLVLLVLAILRRRSASTSDDRGARRLVFSGGFLAPLLVLSALFAFAVRTLPATSAPSPGETTMTVQVVGKQWFWEARYPGTAAVTANEIHIPARTPVRLEVTSADVIHSFWLPRLNRKIDLIPGQTNAIVLEADEPGVYRGQCAEFCGVQHAHMAFLVVADEPADFRAWLRREAAPAVEPTDDATRSGLGAFLAESCAGCHAIRGTAATGTLGPDLTHLASRGTIAALVAPNDRGFLTAWITDPQHLKPGARMPALVLSEEQRDRIVDYLESLR